MKVYVVLYIQTFKMTTMQELQTARNKLATLLACREVSSSVLDHLGEKAEERIEGELKLRMQKLQCKLYHLLALYCHQEQNIDKHLILFSNVLINNTPAKHKKPEHRTVSCLHPELPKVLSGVTNLLIPAALTK